ncbi:hypothetical protein H4683_000767 [Filibacter limicola]|uniref:Uncharacterized protein n=1 Tax=Sporosarcina limicola TaxID=34101 RepID=A0A927MGZ1_9BACL|nr:hypothetical protein [Sporosarcina limicola]
MLSLYEPSPERQGGGYLTFTIEERKPMCVVNDIRNRPEIDVTFCPQITAFMSRFV